MTSRRESNVEKNGFIDTEYSSGDSNMMQCKLKQRYREENNNEVDELSKDLQMGCIVDAVKRPPNICVETCVYEGSESGESAHEIDEDEAAYTDEFEDDKSDGADSIKIETQSATNEKGTRQEQGPTSLKLSKSNSFMSGKPSGSVKSGSTSLYGSLPVPKTRRINMSFTNDRLREIERHNHILLNKILSARNQRKSSIPPLEPEPAKTMRPAPSAAIRRKKQQREIDHANMRCCFYLINQKSKDKMKWEWRIRGESSYESDFF